MKTAAQRHFVKYVYCPDGKWRMDVANAFRYGQPLLEIMVCFPRDKECPFISLDLSAKLAEDAGA
jgi:hypothetical protein